MLKQSPLGLPQSWFSSPPNTGELSCMQIHFQSKTDYERVNLTSGNTSVKVREVELKSQVLIKHRCFIVRLKTPRLRLQQAFKNKEKMCCWIRKLERLQLAMLGIYGECSIHWLRPTIKFTVGKQNTYYMKDTSYKTHLASDVLRLGLTSDIPLSIILALLLLLPAECSCYHLPALLVSWSVCGTYEVIGSMNITFSALIAQLLQLLFCQGWDLFLWKREWLLL